MNIYREWAKKVWLQALWAKPFGFERALSWFLVLWAKMSSLIIVSGLSTCRCTMTEKLPLLRGEGTDYQIELKEIDERESKVFWDSLYNMTREKLLVLQNTLTELLNKQFIWVSNSFAAVSVLFIQKSEDELWFCVNYCGLNWITQKNCYSLSLIYETLQKIKQA